MIKIAENIDSIFAQFGSYPPVLPHAEFIDEFIHKIRKKLKVVDSGSASSSSLKSFLLTILSNADILEGLKIKQLVTCQHLSEIRASVHTPLLALLEKYTKLPSAPSESNEVAAAAQAMDAIECQYNTIKSSPLLVKMVTLRLEAECIENIVSEMLHPLRAAAEVISSPGCAAQQRESVWSRSLLPLLACPTGELLARCCHK